MKSRFERRFANDLPVSAKQFVKWMDGRRNPVKTYQILVAMEFPFFEKDGRVMVQPSKALEWLSRKQQEGENHDG